MNKLKIIKDADLKNKVFLNGIELKRVTAFSYNKTSAYDKTEAVITIVVDELEETLK